MNNISARADWHAREAFRHYNAGRLDDYKRHMHKADELRAVSGETVEAKKARLQNAFSHRR